LFELVAISSIFGTPFEPTLAFSFQSFCTPPLLKAAKAKKAKKAKKAAKAAKAKKAAKAAKAAKAKPHGRHLQYL